MPPSTEPSAVRRLPWLAVLVGLAIAVPPPLLTWAASWRGLSDQAQSLAFAVATDLETARRNEPRLWRYAAPKQVARTMRGPAAVGVRSVEVLACDGSSLHGTSRAEGGRVGPAAFAAVGAPAALGWVRVELDGTPALRMSGTVAVFAAILALLAVALLWFGPFAQIREEATARAAEVEAAVAQVRALGRASLRAVEAERNRIARDLHDDLGQQLTAMRLSLEGDPPDPVAVAQARDRLDEANSAMRAVVADLRPAGLSEDRVAGTLDAACSRFEEAHGVAVVFRHDGPELHDAVIAAALLRVLREALHNARRHGDAEEIAVRLAIDADELRLAIHDDGSGLPPGVEPLALGRGLAGLRQRLGLLGGELTLASRDGDGVRVLARLPAAAWATHGSRA